MDYLKEKNYVPQINCIIIFHGSRIWANIEFSSLSFQKRRTKTESDYHTEHITVQWGQSEYFWDIKIQKQSRDFFWPDSRFFPFDSSSNPITENTKLWSPEAWPALQSSWKILKINFLPMKKKMLMCSWRCLEIQLRPSSGSGKETASGTMLGTQPVL